MISYINLSNLTIKLILILIHVKKILFVLQMREIRNELPPEISENESYKNLHSEIEYLLETVRMQVSDDNSTFPAYQNYLGNTAVQDMSQTNGLAVSYAKATHQSSSGTPEVAQMEGQKEVIEQFEPGVYVTVIQLANGTKIFKGVRFRYVSIRLFHIKKKLACSNYHHAPCVSLLHPRKVGNSFIWI